jgi:hypothetical protein
MAYVSALENLNGALQTELAWDTVLAQGTKKILQKEKKKVANYESCQETMRTAFESLVQEEKRNKKGYKTLKDLPQDWWVAVRFMAYGYQYQTTVTVAGLPDYKIDSLLDGGAGINSVAEELVIACLNVCDMKRIVIDNPPSQKEKHPFVAFEKPPRKEFITGVVQGAGDVQLMGDVVVRVVFKDIFSKKTKEQLIRFKIMPKGTSSFLGFIIGGKALDCVENGGLGHSPQPRSHFLAAVGIHLERLEDSDRPRDKTGVLAVHYRCGTVTRQKLQGLRPAMSIFDAADGQVPECESDDSIPSLAASEGSDDSGTEEPQQRWHPTYAHHLLEGSKGDEAPYDVLVADVPEGVCLEAQDGAIVRKSTKGH